MKSQQDRASSHRLLIVDDNPSIHDDIRKTVCPDALPLDVADDETAIFGTEATKEPPASFRVDSAYQGQEGLAMVERALAEEQSYSLAFVDVRMPPGWDGVETIERLWKADPRLQIVICTAYSDHSWEDIQSRLGASDSLLVLRKPFDRIEVLQIAHALTRKWDLAREAQMSIDELNSKVAERTRALETEMAERARLEGSLRQVQKMEAVGQLAAGLAHDFNNILTIIQLNIADLLLASKGLASETSILREVALASERASSLVRQLLVFSRKETLCPKYLDLNQALAKFRTFLGRVLGGAVKVSIHLADSPACLKADEQDLDQIVLNLALNARDAMPGGGEIALRSSVVILAAKDAQRHAQARPGCFVCLALADTGCGMDAAILARIFEPFFTTKEIGKGTGLGLATVYGIVQRHNGWIEVDSEPGKGTTFKVFFPQDECPARPAAKSLPRAISPPPNPADLTILLVEDEKSLRQIARHFLNRSSFRTLEAADGVEALDVWARHASEVDILFTDIMMPNRISGLKLAEMLREERPELKVIYSSGNHNAGIGPELLRKDEAWFLPKPYTSEDLLSVVSEAAVAVKSPASRARGD
jgi:signal transduction histidine kinase